jgi:hypothetical protein
MVAQYGFCLGCPWPACANLTSNKFEVGMVGAQATLAYDHPIAYPDPRINSYHILTYLFRFTNQNYLEDVGDPASGFAVSKTVI